MKPAVAVLLAALVSGGALAQSETVIRDGPILDQATQVGRNLARAPTDTATLQQLVEKTPHSDVMEVLYLVIRESIRESNEDKKFYLSKLKQQNAIAASLRAHREDMADASSSLADCASPAGCGPQVISDQTAKMEASLVRVEAAIDSTAIPEAQREDVEHLRGALERDRQLIALTRQHLTVAPAPRRTEMGVEALPLGGGGDRYRAP